MLVMYKLSVFGTYPPNALSLPLERILLVDKRYLHDMNKYLKCYGRNKQNKHILIHNLIELFYLPLN